MLVRRINAHDIIPMVNMGEIMHKAGSYKKIGYNKDKIFKTIKASIGSNNMAWFIAEDKGEYIGMMGGFITEYSISYDKYASDFLIFVLGDKRGGKAAGKLLNSFEKWAMSKGVKEIRPGSSHGIETERVKKFYESKKYETIGHLFRKEL